METNIAPPLDLDLNTVDTSMPLLAKGIYDLQVTKVEKKKTSKGGDMLAIELSTTAPSKSVKDEDLGIGIKVFYNLNLSVSGKATWDIIKRNVAAVVQAAQVQTNWGEFTNNPAILQGRIVRCSVDVAPAGVDKNGKAYREKNEILVFMKPS
jgi:hypothetical protein